MLASTFTVTGLGNRTVLIFLTGAMYKSYTREKFIVNIHDSWVYNTSNSRDRTGGGSERLPWPLIRNSEVVSSWVVTGVQTVTDCYSSQWMDGGNPLVVMIDHSTAIVDSQLYLWVGHQDGMPGMTDSVKGRQFICPSVEVFDVNTGCWEQRTTRGTPPLGVQGYSCVAVRNELHYFGGRYGHGDHCYHNSVHTLSTSTLQWSMLAPTTTKRWGTNAKESMWNGALHWWRGGPLVCGGRVWSCCPNITTTWSTVSTD